MLKIDKVVKKVVVTGTKLFVIGLGLKGAYKLGKFMGYFEETAKLCTDDAAYDTLNNARESLRECFKFTAHKEGEDTYAECDESTEPTSEDTAEEA